MLTILNGRQTKIGGAGPDADFGYRGYYVHQRSGLNFTSHRACSPPLGRFLSRDPIEENGGINLYAYVGNNPINFADPSGLKADSERCVRCPQDCDNSYNVTIPEWCTEATRTGRDPNGNPVTYVTTYFQTQNGSIYQAVTYGDAEERRKKGLPTCYWQKTQ